jgi:hypothetical protein
VDLKVLLHVVLLFEVRGVWVEVGWMIRLQLGMVGLLGGCA